MTKKPPTRTFSCVSSFRSARFFVLNLAKWAMTIGITSAKRHPSTQSMRGLLTFATLLSAGCAALASAGLAFGWLGCSLALLTSMALAMTAVC